MRKALCALIITAMIFSLSACSGGGGNKTTDPPSPGIEEQNRKQEFKDNSGKTVFVVDVVLPKAIDNCSESAINYINGVADKVFADACRDAENNIENAAEFMNNTNSDTPWTKKIDFETTFSNGRFTCFLMKEYLYFSTGEVEPTLSTLCFDTVNASLCSAMDFVFEPDTQKVQKILIEDYIRNSAYTQFYEDGTPLTDEQLDALGDEFSIENFYLTHNGVAFYFLRAAVDPTMDGTYICEIPWGNLGFAFSLPDDLLYEIATQEQA